MHVSLSSHFTYKRTMALSSFISFAIIEWADGRKDKDQLTGNELDKENQVSLWMQPQRDSPCT